MLADVLFAGFDVRLTRVTKAAEGLVVDAIEEARPDAAPALVALYRVTANVLRVKNTWRFTLSHTTVHTEASAALWAEIDAHTRELLKRAQREGLLAPDADLDWTRQVYYALLGEALNRPGADEDPDMLATLVIDPLLHGAGPRS
ncbi:TetR/AcrR family transcriptional regulator [Streptomyces sp. NPDC093510]|uniref:TetR/AcrR family transcriptional regulator n=1 Tax=Streptomyces sp. NPDC093510 TaxID=3155199 RepID=UPI00341C29F3